MFKVQTGCYIVYPSSNWGVCTVPMSDAMATGEVNCNNFIGHSGVSVFGDDQPGVPCL